MNNKVLIAIFTVAFVCVCCLSVVHAADGDGVSGAKVVKDVVMKPKYEIKTYTAVVDCPDIKTVKKMKKILKSEIKDGYGNWRNYKVRMGIREANSGDFYKLKVIKYGKVSKKCKDYYVVKKFKGYKTVYKTFKGLYGGKITKNGVYRTNIVKKMYYKYGGAKTVKTYIKVKDDGIYCYGDVKVPYKKVPVYKEVIKSKKVKFNAWRYKISIKVYNEVF